MEGPISVPIKPTNVRTRTNAATGDAQDGARRGRKRSNNNTSGYTMYAKKMARRNTNRVRLIAYTPYKSAATITTVNVTRAALASHRIMWSFSFASPDASRVIAHFAYSAGHLADIGHHRKGNQATYRHY